MNSRCAVILGALALTGSLIPRSASACGGFFCSQAAPVNQAAERIVFSENGDGTVTDLRLRDPRMHEPGFRDDAWVPASVVDIDPRRFEPRSAPPVRTVAELPMSVAAHRGRVRLDGGQNISGWVRLVVRGRAGEVVTVRHAEVLEPSGDLHLKALHTKTFRELERKWPTAIEGTRAFFNLNERFGVQYW